MRTGILALFFTFTLTLTTHPVFAQVVDESTTQDAIYTGVGRHADDFVAQSFVADIWQVSKIGAWLRADSAGGEVHIALVADNGNDRPDLNLVFHETTLLMPDAIGRWYIDSSFTTVLQPGLQYWLVVDGFNNLGTSGFSSVGSSNSYTDTGDAMFRSTDGGQTWDSVPNQPLAVLIEGDTCQFNVNINPPIPVLCPGDSILLEVPTGFAGYAWSSGQTTAEIYATQLGTYSVMVVAADYCVATASTNVLSGVQPDPQLDSLIARCGPDTIELSVNPFFNSYLWSTGETTPAITVTTEGTYWIEVTSAAGCVGRDTAIVDFLPLPTVSLSGDTSICEGEFVLLDAGPGFQGYSWSTGASTRSVFIDQTMSVWVEVLGANGCAGRSDTVLVTVNPNPAIPVITVDFNGLTSTFGFGYQWYRDGVAIQGATDQVLPDPTTGVYHVVVSNGFGCTSQSDTLSVVVEEFGNFISEGFSPNGDGLNEVFFVEGISRFPENILVVFNRWGEEVLRRAPYANDWNGTGPGGKPLPDGNYFYVLEFGNGAPARRGTVLINR